MRKLLCFMAMLSLPLCSKMGFADVVCFEDGAGGMDCGGLLGKNVGASVVGIERNAANQEVTISRELHDHIAGEGLIATLNQAASKPVLEDGALVGFTLFEIDSGSVYDLAGLDDGDLVTHIDDVPLRDARYVIELLRYVKGQPAFSYTVRHCVERCDHFWTHSDQVYGEPVRFKVRVSS